MSRGRKAALGGPRSRRQRARSKGLQLTRVGVWYLIAGVVVAVAATNTGNNGLFLTVAAMAAAFVVSHAVAALNVSQLRVVADAEAEVFANAPSYVRVSVHNTRRWLPSWLVMLSVGPEDLDPPERRHRSRPMLVPYLAGGKQVQGQIEVHLRLRGPRRLRSLDATSFFPLGLFRKGRTHPQEVEILVFPEIRSASATAFSDSGTSGEATEPRVGQGQELHSLREYRQGDDPRGIHWKQTARQRRLIFQQRARETERRLKVVFDNAVGELEDDSAVDRFEGLVSEAATAMVEALAAGFQVALVTREENLDYGTGPRHRRRLLEVLAYVQAVEEQKSPLDAGEEAGASLRFGSAKREAA